MPLRASEASDFFFNILTDNKQETVITEFRLHLDFFFPVSNPNPFQFQVTTMLLYLFYNFISMSIFP